MPRNAEVHCSGERGRTRCRFGASRSHNRGTKLTNSVVWGNTLASVFIMSDQEPVEVSFSDIEGGHEGVGNIDADPLFVGRFGWEYLLHPDSPCIDAGDPDSHDHLYDTWPHWPERIRNGPECDLGAYGGPRNWGWVDLFDDDDPARMRAARAAR